MPDAAGLLRQAANCLVKMPLALMVIGPDPHTAHAQGGQGGLAAQRQVNLHTSVNLMRPSSEMTAHLLWILLKRQANNAPCRCHADT